MNMTTKKLMNQKKASTGIEYGLIALLLSASTGVAYGYLGDELEESICRLRSDVIVAFEMGEPLDCGVLVADGSTPIDGANPSTPTEPTEPTEPPLDLYDPNNPENPYDPTLVTLYGTDNSLVYTLDFYSAVASTNNDIYPGYDPLNSTLNAVLNPTYSSLCIAPTDGSMPDTFCETTLTNVPNNESVTLNLDSTGGAVIYSGFASNSVAYNVNFVNNSPINALQLSSSGTNNINITNSTGMSETEVVAGSSTTFINAENGRYVFGSDTSSGTYYVAASRPSAQTQFYAELFTGMNPIPGAPTMKIIDNMNFDFQCTFDVVENNDTITATPISGGQSLVYSWHVGDISNAQFVIQGPQDTNPDGSPKLDANGDPVYTYEIINEPCNADSVDYNYLDFFYWP